jgi:hypothetical protein
LFMPSRFRVFSSVCVFAVLFTVQLLAQSNSASFAGTGAPALKRTTRLSNGLQTPALNFASAVSYFSGGNGANAVAIADVNGDGKPDLVVTNWCAFTACTDPSTIGVLLGKGDGTFPTLATYPSGGLFADSVAIADVNGDGKPDLIVANCGSNSQTNCVSTSNSGNVAVLLGNGDGTFQSAVTYSLGASGATSVAVADVNGDGKPDLIVATGSNTAGLVGVLLGNGNGTFQAEATYGSGGISPLAVAVGNLGNGHFDVVVANECADDTCTSSDVGVLLGNGDGTFQTVLTYDSGGLFADSVAIVDVNRDGKPDVVVANSSTSSTVDNGNVGVLLGKGDGTFQTTVAYGSGAFGAASVAVADVNGDGKLDLVVANCSGTASSCVGTKPGDVGVLLGNGNGTFQTAVTYAAGGNTPFGVAVGDVNGDGKPDIVAANCFHNNCGAANGSVGVLINSTIPWPLRSAALCEQVDYFGELKADFTVWRPSTWYWYSIDGTGNLLVKNWGANGDIPVIGDYDGDGKTDVTIYRPSNGAWYIIQSSNGKVVTKVWGVPGDVPVPGDYDGDGKTDTAIYRPSNMVWYIVQSSNGKVVTKQWGEPGDVPVPGDYDGDGKTDIAMYRPSNMVWYIIQSSNGEVVTKQWGEPGDVPVPADYDGDGKTDIAMYRPSNGYWFVIQSSTGKVVTQQWGGQPGDKPVPRDYDGDLKADFAIWRPTNGIWYVIQSSNNQHTTHQWGFPTDIPLNKPVGQ